MPSANKRRLSNGKSLVEIDEDENDNENSENITVATGANKSSANSMRRASMGSILGMKSPTLNLEEQIRITEMYKRVIQLSTENVIIIRLC